jgi:hypothetical protein
VSASDPCGEIDESSVNLRCGVDESGRWSCQRMTSGGLCPRCAERSGTWLAELADLLPRLPDALMPGSSGEGPRVSGSREAPLPLRVTTLNLLGPAAGWDRSALDRGDARSGEMQFGDEPLLSVLLGWARIVADLPQLKGQRKVLPTDGTLYSMERLRALRTYLATHHDIAAQQFWADDYAADVQAMWRTCRRLLGVVPLRHHLPAPCPEVSCDLMTLWRNDGEDDVYCDTRQGGCGRTWSADDYARLVLVLASEHRGAA